MSNPARAVFGLPGTVTLKGRQLTIPAPAAADVARVHEEMRRLALRDCTSPVLAVNAVAEQLLPGVLAEALRAAVAMSAGGGAEPSREAVQRQYETLDGVRFRVWFYARKAHPALTREEVDGLVGEDDRFDAADALFRALGLEDLDPGKAKPAGAS